MNTPFCLVKNFVCNYLSAYIYDSASGKLTGLENFFACGEKKLSSGVKPEGEGIFPASSYALAPCNKRHRRSDALLITLLASFNLIAYISLSFLQREALARVAEAVSVVGVT